MQSGSDSERRERALFAAPNSFFLQRMAQLRNLPHGEGFYHVANQRDLDERAKYFAHIASLESRERSVDPILTLPQPAWLIPLTVGLADLPLLINFLDVKGFNLAPIVWAFLAIGLPEERDLPFAKTPDDQKTVDGAAVFFNLEEAFGKDVVAQMGALLSLWSSTDPARTLYTLSRELACFLSMRDDPTVSFHQSRKDIVAKAVSFADAIAQAGFTMNTVTLHRLDYLLPAER